MGKDIAITVALCVGTFLLYCYGAGNLEFFRHTEADRTLIAWSMLEAKSFAIPNILGISIFTKPPLFYWMVAGAIYLFGSTAEMVVRMPSIIVASLFVGTQYIVLRKAKFDTFMSFLGALFLCSSVQFARTADAVEIDMTFAFLCAMAFSLMFFSISKASLKLALLSYAFCALAFLTKGYPIIGFMGGVVVVYYLLQRWVDKGASRIGISKFIIWNCLGATVFLVIVGTWVYFVFQQPYGQAYLSEYLLGEFRHRIAENNGRKSLFFYLPVILTSIAPWSVLLVVGLVVPFCKKLSQSSYREYFADKDYRNFFLFNLVVVLTGVVLLSIPAGKAERYYMPLLSATINLAVCGLVQIKNSKMPDYLYRIGKYLFITFAVACAVLPVSYFVGDRFATYVPMINTIKWTLFILSLCVVGACFKKSSTVNVAVIIVSLLVWRYIFAVPYVEARNQENSVKAFVSVINKTVPTEESIYFEVDSVQRWFAYYLKRLGRNVYILSSAVVEDINSVHSDVDSVYIIVSLKNLDINLAKEDGFEELARFVNGKHSVVLIKVRSEAISLINTKAYIEWI